MAHKMYNIKQKSPIEENPQNEVLQPYIKTGKRLTALFYWPAIAVDYTLYIEKISAWKVRSITHPYTIQAPL